ncbi:MAG: Fic family protein [Bacteroidales bacterium]|jgi:Fic family protein|nr:Fic family protein [Bacteroidota bacterium]NLO00582.1 Fic family protein [Bacteroidales bacterium]
MRSFSSGRFISQGTYKSFSPTHIDREWDISDMETISLLSKADRMLGRLDMFSEHVPNVNLFIAMHIVKEATQSTRIEGTLTKIGEAILPEKEIPLDKRDDWNEVQNYIRAMNSAIQKLDTLPLSSRLIREVHSILMQGVRGEFKQPGEFRTAQNWIGGNSLSDAVFIPPIAPDVPELMSDIEKFIHNSRIMVPDLIKIAIIHYQFETIHPFNDGNGRVGRLLITLYLVSKGLLKKPVLYLSDYLERNRNAYYTKIMKVRSENDIKGWIDFFLHGVIETAAKSVETFEKTLELQKDYENRIKGMGSRSANAMTLLSHLYKIPSVNAKDVSRICGITIASAYSLISEMESRGILSEVTGSRRGRLYILEEYLHIYSE